tara:strand:- start:489 stop:1208 length:720 start_codon:yes stop_codon:yes gene_type:complete
MGRFFIFFSTIIIISANIRCVDKCDSFKQNSTLVYGIDVSHYQNKVSKIDWKAVSENKNPKISFAYIRTTMGKDGEDEAFDYNFKEAQKHGIKVGVYHYYRPNENSIEQVNNFLKNNPTTGDLPPVVDIEEKSRLGAKNLRKGIANFLKLVENKYKKKPIIYAHQRFYNTYLRNKFPAHEIWIARQNGFTTHPHNNMMKKEPILLDNKCPKIWQYSGTGTIKGINGNVDLNVMQDSIWE